MAQNLQDNIALTLPSNNLMCTVSKNEFFRLPSEGETLNINILNGSSNKFQLPEFENNIDEGASSFPGFSDPVTDDHSEGDSDALEVISKEDFMKSSSEQFRSSFVTHSFTLSSSTALPSLNTLIPVIRSSQSKSLKLPKVLCDESEHINFAVQSVVPEGHFSLKNIKVMSESIRPKLHDALKEYYLETCIPDYGQLNSTIYLNRMFKRAKISSTAQVDPQNIPDGKVQSSVKDNTQTGAGKTNSKSNEMENYFAQQFYDADTIKKKEVVEKKEKIVPLKLMFDKSAISSAELELYLQFAKHEYSKISTSKGNEDTLLLFLASKKYDIYQALKLLGSGSKETGEELNKLNPKYKSEALNKLDTDSD